MIKIETRLLEDMHFASNDGVSQDYHMDASHGDLLAPISLVLTALTGCSGMDVITITRKMKQKVTDFKITAEAEKADDHPKVYTKIMLTYFFTGEQLEEEKLKKAIELSLNKYCSVSAMLKKTAEIEYKLIIN